MVDCYCGCDSKGNRVKFAVAGTLFFVGIALVLICPQMALGCFKKIDFECQLLQMNGDEEGYKKYGCEQATEDMLQCNSEHSGRLMVQVFLMMLGELLMVLATVPLCVLCCCTKKPQQAVWNQPPATALHRGNTYEAI